MKKIACSKTIHFVTETDLPLSCPMPNQQLYDAHPRIFLPIKATGKICCPYCGTLYAIKKTHPK